MKIAIIGAGAMGCLFGGKLSQSSSNEVCLLDVWKDHMDAVNANGLIMEEGDKTLNYPAVKGFTDAGAVGPVDLAIVFVKSTLTAQAVASNKAVFGPETLVLTLQNGMGNLDLIGAEIGSENLLAGTTSHGALMLGPGKMRHTGIGGTTIGELDGKATDRIEKVAACLREAGMETEISDNVLGLVWDKLLVNVGINALTGITKLHNGELLEHPEINLILEMAVKEAEAVAKAKGILLGFPDGTAHCRQVASATAANKSSMLQDILGGKKTEIDMINGAIVKEGAALGVPTPVNQVLTSLIQFMEKPRP